MPRRKRRKSAIGLYHVMARGVGKQNIFYEAADYQAYYRYIKKAKKMYGYEIYAYCLLGNHVHFLIWENKSDISEIIHYINSQYAAWFNRKYSRQGHLFQDRFLSEPVEDEIYFCELIHYIHRNPIKAGLADKLEKYPYCSYKEYYLDKSKITDMEKVKEYFGQYGFLAMHNIYSYGRNCIDIQNEYRRLTELEAKKVICSLMKNENPLLFVNLKEDEQIRIVEESMERKVTLAQITRITGIPYNRVRYLGKKGKLILFKDDDIIQ